MVNQTVLYRLIRHCVFYGVESWSGVLEWRIGVRFWSGKSRMVCSCDACVCGQVLCNPVIVMNQ